MVYGICYFPLSKSEKLKELGFAGMFFPGKSSRFGEWKGRGMGVGVGGRDYLIKGALLIISHSVTDIVVLQIFHVHRFKNLVRRAARGTVQYH